LFDNYPLTAAGIAVLREMAQRPRAKRDAETRYRELA
jgi:hypothetical protein